MPDAGEPVTFNVFIRDPGAVPSKDNPVIRRIAELTGVTIEFEFLVGDLDQKVELLLPVRITPMLFLHVSKGSLMPVPLFHWRISCPNIRTYTIFILPIMKK